MATYEEGKAEGESLPTKDNFSPQTTLCSDPSFDAINFTGDHLPFPKDFPIDYKGLYDMSLLELLRMTKNHLLRGLLIDKAQREK